VQTSSCSTLSSGMTSGETQEDWFSCCKLFSFVSAGDTAELGTSSCNTACSDITAVKTEEAWLSCCELAGQSGGDDEVCLGSMLTWLLLADVGTEEDC